MSTLMCAATLVVARHGDATYVEAEFSDEGGSLTTEGRGQARALAEALAGRRVAHVWCSDVSRSVQTAEIAAARWGVAVTARKSLREVDIGDLRGQPFSLDALDAVTSRWFDGDLAARFPGGESGAEVVDRIGAAFGEIADLHRGETVLVVAHQTAVCIALPVLARNLSPVYAEHHQLDNGASAELEIDDDWVVTRWGDVLVPVVEQ